MQNLTEQIQTEVGTATAKATDEAVSVFTQRINDVADKATQKIADNAKDITDKVKETEQEVVRVKDEIHFERGFRKFFFWVTPILLLAQTVVSMFLLLR